jgi:DDE superfamily endonuclease
MTIHGATVQFAARRKTLRQVFAPGWALLACLLVVVQAPSELRAPVVIVFFCFVPGTALVGLFNPDSFGVELSLTVALSVAVSGLTAGVLLYANLWSPTAVVVIVTGISLVAGLRDFRLGHSERQAASLFFSRRAGSWRVRARGLPAALLQAAQLAGRGAGSVSGGISAIPRGANRVGRRPRRRIALGSRREGAVDPPAPASPLQGFLQHELSQRTGSSDHGSRRRRPPRSLANLEPHELSELLSWSSLQRYVTQRALREVKPELWFVEDLERRLGPHAPDEPSGRTPAVPRGVWITGVSARTSIPVVWRVLEDSGNKDWRTQLALEMIDALPEPGVGDAVVAADTDYGSLAGLRRGLTARGLSYLFRVDPVTAARELVPDRPSRSAAEARALLREQLPELPRPHDAREETELVFVQGAEQILIHEGPATGRAEAFWLSNLPAGTPPERLAALLGLANRGRVEPEAADLLQVALKMTAEEGTGLDRELALVALAGGLQALDVSTTEGGEQR